MKRFSRIVIPLGVLTALLALNVTASFAQQPEAAPEGATQAQVAPSPHPRGPMMGEGPHAMMRPGMPFCCPCCGCGMGWGMGGMMGMPMMGMPMMGGAMGRDPKRAAKMMEMHADIMKAVAEVMEKYAKELQGGQ